MAAVHVQHFLDRARDFLKGMDLLKDDLAGYKFSLALLGIHCAISYSDALRTGMGCVDVSSDDHRNAPSDLKQRLADRKFEKTQGAVRFERLLSKKNRIEYDPVTVRENEVEDIVIQAMRFADWAEEAGKALKIEGW
jgi:virulence-associated protein VapD